MFTIGEVILIGLGCFILGAVTASLPDIEIIIKGQEYYYDNKY